MGRKFGGLGGIRGGRERLPEDDFENAVERSMGERLRAECKAYGVKGLGSRLYGSITNQAWKHVNGDSVWYSFRAAGDLIAAVIGYGDYMDWYCSSPEGVVDDEVRELLAKEGWKDGVRNDREMNARMDATVVEAVSSRSTTPG